MNKILIPNEDIEGYVALVNEMMDKILDCISEEEFNKLVCPSCGHPASIKVHPKLTSIFVTCSADSSHFGRTASSNNACEWWKGKISNGWLD